MKTKLRALTALLAFLPAALFAADKSKNCGCSCCKGKEVCCCHADEAKAADTKAEVRHPLRGVITDIRAADSALLVRHEEIPGYMRAMTMLFKVDAAALAAAQKGQAITATLVRRGDEFWLEDIKPAATK